ncbi:MAG: FKBP-type peptidyl-prolyl cis-trans isomerase [Lachnospiraceae bacterium]|nr:FKBP-type peptidyl-prolyl cis-trans isomerase [Lachnospiraceae bacterium]
MNPEDELKDIENAAGEAADDAAGEAEKISEEIESAADAVSDEEGMAEFFGENDIEEFADDASSDFDNEIPVDIEGVAPRKSSKGPIIAIACVFIAAIIGVVVWLGLKDKEGKGKAALKTEDYYKEFTYDAYTPEVATNSDAEKYYSDTITTYNDMYSQVGMSFYEKDESRNNDKVAEGDTVSVSYAGYMDGVQFEGGTGTSNQLTIGSGSMIPGFEDGLVGVAVGETVSLNLTFPEDYTNTPEYAGKAVTFDCTINYICKETSLTEDNAYSIIFGYDTRDACIDAIIAYLNDNPQTTEEDYMMGVKDDYIKYVVDGAEYDKTIDAKIQERYETVYKMYEDYATNAGIDVDTIAQQMGYEDVTGLKENILDVCGVQVKAEIVFAQLAEKEKITISDEDYHSYAYECAYGAGYNETDEQGNTDENATIAAYEQEYNASYGEGMLDTYIKTVYYENTLFDKYAKVKE